ncbi:hypothetical protein F4780DRAFT_184294 [Xylariomycetidae sp. FL0641]|nr:hypothetical protein F4780DRAFT_184294 [Xylariomycetidae sp. FL0641]
MPSSRCCLRTMPICHWPPVLRHTDCQPRPSPLFLRISSILTVNFESKGDVDLVIQRTLKLKEQSHHSTSNGSELGQILANLIVQGEQIQRLDNAGYRIINAFEHAINRIDRGVKSLQDGITELHENLTESRGRTTHSEAETISLKEHLKAAPNAASDIPRYERLEHEIGSAKEAFASACQSLRKDIHDFAKEQHERHHAVKSNFDSISKDLANMRKELSDTKKVAEASVVTCSAYATEVQSLKSELEQFKGEAARDRRYKPLSNNCPLPTPELGILADNITKIGQRASQVEPLHMEIELLKSRIQRMESETLNSEKIPHSNLDFQRPLNYHPAHLTRGSPLSQLAGAASNTAVSSTATPTKSAKRSTLVDRSGLSPTLNGEPSSSGTKPTKSHRITKAGAIDKRCLKRKHVYPQERGHMVSGKQ